MSNNIDINIISLKKFIEKKNIKIPEYQRPYRWSIKNVNQLLDDILKFKDKSAYRLGTTVFHKNRDNFLNIVDGQQRYITIILIMKAILKTKSYKKFQEEYDNQININSKLEIKNRISKNNIAKNYQEILKRINEFDVETIYFLLNKCEVVEVVLEDISEAFQFFDSQNARGKDLAPHDLLKAFHLREMQDIDEKTKTRLVKDWEELDEQGEMANLFENYLFRIRNWSRGKSARYFTKNEVDIFKGISINTKTKELYPYALMYQIVNIFVEDYNNNSSRKIDFNNLDYPFQLDLPILNGKRFFEMIAHYNERVKNLKIYENDVIKLLKKYKGNHRTGDRYVKNLFECALIYYIDKFGEVELEKVINKLFIWAYAIRLKLQAVRLASIDNRALGSNVFKTIKDAITHHDVANMYIDNIKAEEIGYDVEDIKKEFEKLGYYNGN